MMNLVWNELFTEWAYQIDRRSIEEIPIMQEEKKTQPKLLDRMLLKDTAEPKPPAPNPFY